LFKITYRTTFYDWWRKYKWRN